MHPALVVVALLFGVTVASAQSPEILNKTIIATWSNSNRTGYVYISSTGAIFTSFADETDVKVGISEGHEFKLGSTLRYNTQAGLLVSSYVNTASFSAQTLSLRSSGSTRWTEAALRKYKKAGMNLSPLTPTSSDFKIEFGGDTCRFSNGSNVSQTCRIVAGNQMPFKR